MRDDDFMTAEELEIAEWEREGLLLTRDVISKMSGRNFNMEVSCRSASCGTVACIGGWLYILSKFDEHQRAQLAAGGDTGDLWFEVVEYVEKHRTGKLRQLFFPHGVVDWARLTPQHAVQAIDNFLTTGFPHWTDVYNDDPGE